jgi:hypothetical protein
MKRSPRVSSGVEGTIEPLTMPEEQHARRSRWMRHCAWLLFIALAGCGNPAAARESRAIMRMRQFRGVLAEATRRCGRAPSRLADLGAGSGVPCTAGLSVPAELEPLLHDEPPILEGYKWDYRAGDGGASERSTYALRASYIAKEGLGRSLRLDERGVIEMTRERGGSGNEWVEVGP